MNFSRCVSLLKFAQRPVPNANVTQSYRLRFFSKKVLFTSNSPQVKVQSNPDEFLPEDLDDGYEEEVEKVERQVRKKYVVPKKNFRIDDDPKYQRDSIFNTITSYDGVAGNEKNHFQASREREERLYNILESQRNQTQSKNSLSTEETSENDIKVTESEDSGFQRSKTLETVDGKISFDLGVDEFHKGEFLKEFKMSLPKPLDECQEDLSSVGLNLAPTFNFAAYADHSELIQQYVHLGVDLHKMEKNQDHMRALLTVDYKKELPMYIQFLHDCGVPADELGEVITKAPLILTEDLDDMKVRIRYLVAHDFNKDSIARIITKNPGWLLWATKKIDERLGHFQNEFKLASAEVRYLATKAPKLITFNFKHIHENTFAVREQMGFNKAEQKVLLLVKPQLWTLSRKKIMDSFHYLHNTMKLSHTMMATQSDVLITRKVRLQNRHEFLVELKKAQYDPKSQGYVAPRRVAVGSDAEFCSEVAKVSIDTYNLFLKTR
ncbi:transcription termination factor 3, mitochondrial [Trichogramma pretiosum]|uniref:transcription termination factor 3, mitochondrial n=1 Tax=Trichogramma pretiosum TaxID=7493 RepID=UPI0006C94596|nr:transcription termination factor 3, mitochondrial [Trichogramma pretiosum]